MPRTPIVYDGGQLTHMGSDELYDYVTRIDSYNRQYDESVERWEINDRAAQTIAALWHSPSNPNSTLLSTMGKVSASTCLGDFVMEYEYRAASGMDKLCLDYLGTYLLSKQNPE